MFCSSIAVDIKITIYSLNGIFINELTEINTKDFFISIPWNGRDNKGNLIANGTYLYNLQIQKNENIVYENIFKISKIK